MLKSKYLYLVILCFLLSSVTKAQKKVDSLLNFAAQEVFINPDNGIKILTDILKTENASIDTKIIALMSISNAYTSKNNLQMALTSSLKTLNYTTETNNYKLKINAYNQIGNQYQQLNMVTKANEYLDKALNLAKNHVKKDSTLHAQLAINYGVKGQLLREEMQTEKALVYFDQAVKELNEIKDNERLKTINLCIMYFNLGNCYLDLGDIETAKNQFVLSYSFASKTKVTRLIASTEKVIAKIEMLEGHFSSALDLLQSAEKNLKEEQNDLALMESTYLNIAHCYLALQNTETHNTYFKKAQKVKENIAIENYETLLDEINQIRESEALQAEKIHSDYSPIKYFLILLNFIFSILIIRFFLLSQKQINQLRKQIKFAK